MTPNFQQQLMQEIFGERPELAFLGHLTRSGLEPGQQKFLRGRASDFLQQLQSGVGRQLVQGGMPTLMPQDFFGGMDFKDELFRYSPRERGMTQGQFAPRTRFQFER